MENLLQNFASGLWIVLGVYCFFGLRKWNKRFSELYDELKEKVTKWVELANKADPSEYDPFAKQEVE